MKKIISLLLVGALSISLVGCGGKKQESVKEPQKQSVEQKQEDKLEKDKEKYAYILDSDKSYQELNDEEQGVNYLYMDKLISGEAKYDDKYKDRVETLRKQKQEKDDKKNAEKKVVTQLSSAEKDKLKNEISKKLEDKNITSVDILTDSQTGKAIASIQLQGNIDKANINKNDMEALSKEIGDRINTIVEKYTIEFIDKNFQLIMQDDTGIITFVE